MSQDDIELTVRSVEFDDADALHRLYSGPQVIRGTLQLPFASRRLWRERLEKPRSGMWQLVAQAGHVLVGHAGLQAYLDKPRRRHAGTIGMAVADEWQGRGVGSTLLQAILDLADNWIGLKRIELEVFADNTPAIALYEKFGFVREGIGRQFALRDGEYADVLLMARLTEFRSPIAIVAE